MEYVYGAMLLHSSGKDISEENVTKVMEAAGVKTDKAKVKALVASLKDVNIEEAIKTAVPVAAAAPAAAPAAEGKPEEKKKKTEEEEKKTEEEAASGLASLFG